MLKTNSVTSWAGVVAAFGVSLAGTPLIVLTTYAQVVKNGPPAWFNPCILPMMLVGVLLTAGGTAVMGLASKGQNEPQDPK